MSATIHILQMRPNLPQHDIQIVYYSRWGTADVKPLSEPGRRWLAEFTIMPEGRDYVTIDADAVAEYEQAAKAAGLLVVTCF